jgi:exopolysaccharide production protein ExoZ
VVFARSIPNPILSAGVLSPAFAAIIYGAAQQPRWLSFLSFPWLVLLGDASYSLYLLHSLLITRTFESLTALSYPIRVAASVVAAILASILVYRVVEQPARKFLLSRRT